MRRRVIVFCGAAVVLAAAALAQGNDHLSKKQLQAIGEGRRLYLMYCTGCHGTDAHGAARTGTDHQGTAPDLTLIAARDGRFDRSHVSTHVGGRYTDCNTEMPCWSKVLGRSRPGAQGFADTKVLALLDYLRFVQEPPAGSQAKP